MIVLDASVATKSYLEEAGADAATELLTGRQPLLAPELIRVEVAAAVCRRFRKGELSLDETQVRCQHWLRQLEQGLITLHPDAELLPDAVAIALKLRHPVQDCLYLAAAQRHRLPLITADRKFHERASPAFPNVQLLAGVQAN